VLGQPLLQDTSDELTAVVAAHVGRRSSLGHQPLHHLDEVLGGQLPSHVQRQAFPAVLVDHRQDAQLAPVVGPIGHKVPTPDVVEPLGLRRDRAGGAASPPGSSPPALHPQPTLPPDALHQLASHLPAVFPQQARELAIAQSQVLPDL
jgi:hypothetical protein